MDSLSLIHLLLNPLSKIARVSRTKYGSAFEIVPIEIAFFY